MLGQCIATAAKHTCFRCFAVATRSHQHRGRRCMSVMAQAANRVPAVEVPVKLEQGYTYLDVRTPEEFQAGRPKNAVNIPIMFRTAEGMVPNAQFVQEVKASFPDTATPIVVGCKAGNRSARAVALLSEYSDLVDNACGYDGWVAANLPVES